MDPSSIWGGKDEDGHCLNGEMKRVDCSTKNFIVCAIRGKCFFTIS